MGIATAFSALAIAGAANALPPKDKPITKKELEDKYKAALAENAALRAGIEGVVGYERLCPAFILTEPVSAQDLSHRCNLRKGPLE
jgi:hypothetical protein